MNVNSANFNEEVLQAALPVVVDFEADWCSYCRRLSPAVNRVAEEQAEKLKLFHLDIDAAPELANRYGVDVIPTLALFRNGALMSSVVNPGSQDGIEAWLRENGVL